MEFSINRNYVTQYGERETRLTFTIVIHTNLKIFYSNIDNFDLFYSHYVSSDVNCKFRYLTS